MSDRPTNGNLKTEEVGEALWYELMWGRRQHFEALLWQTPAILFAAQSFLFALALGPGVSQVGRIIASLLLVILGAATLVLMLKHRYLEVRTARALAKFERDKGLPQVHGRRGHARGASTRAYVNWIWFVAFTTLAAVTVFFISALRPTML